MRTGAAELRRTSLNCSLTKVGIGLGKPYQAKTDRDIPLVILDPVG